MTDAMASLSGVDDCWNRIGIRGDKSCGQLAEHVHCRNCPVYAAAAKRILDRLPPAMQEDEEAAPPQHAANLSSLLVFRLHRERIGRPTGSLGEVAGTPGIIRSTT